MRSSLAWIVVALAATCAAAQTAGQAPDPQAASPTTGSASMTAVLPDLDHLQTAASQAAINLGHMRIEKWKADNDSKRQAQANADSVQRNLTEALPGLIDAARSSPQDLAAEFKLYRNLNALYDVFASLAESAGAFGPRNDYEDLLPQLQVIDNVRRNLGDALERLTTSNQLELNQLRLQVRTLQQAHAATPPPKKVVVDDTQPARKKASSKKKSGTSSTSKPDGQASSNPSQ